MDALFTAIAIPAWAALIGALAVVLVIISLFRGSHGHESHGSLGVLTQFALVVVIGGAAYLGLRHLEDSAKRAERQAFESRATALLARAAQPGSVLACLDGASDPALVEACERTLFAEPQRVAAALSHVRERLLFVADAVAYAEARDASYLDRIKELRDNLEGDTYGFVAHVLASEDKCTPDSCARFRFLRNPAKVKENLEAKRLETLVAKHANSWREPAKPPMQKSETPESAMSTVVAAPPSEPSPEDTTAAAPPQGPTPPSATTPPTPPARAAARQKQKDKDKDKGGPRAGRRLPEPVAGLPRVVPRRYLEQQEEEEEAPTPPRPGTPGQPPAASALPPPTSITPPRQN